MTETRIGDWMQTFTGRQFWPLDPRPDEIFIEDIAHALSMQCRYAGHCLRFYSVAEHSVLLSRAVRDACGGLAEQRWALLHDASEAYLVDVPRPVKPHLTGYRDAEAKVMAAVCERFDLSPWMPSLVHEFDGRIIGDERVNLSESAEPWTTSHEPLGVRLRNYDPEAAEGFFLVAFDSLFPGMIGS